MGTGWQVITEWLIFSFKHGRPTDVWQSRTSQRTKQRKIYKPFFHGSSWGLLCVWVVKSSSKETYVTMVSPPSRWAGKGWSIFSFLPACCRSVRAAVFVVVNGTLIYFSTLWGMIQSLFFVYSCRDNPCGCPMLRFIQGGRTTARVVPTAILRLKK